MPGVQLQAFHPIEPQHDSLWRITRNLPKRGWIGIFNRSYYEGVLIARVHPETLLTEGIPGKQAGDKPKDNRGDKTVRRHRYRSITDLEHHLGAAGTHMVKSHLHLSIEEQRKRLQQRIDDPSKNWKFSFADVEERQFWKQCRTAYEDCIAATSPGDTPWYIAAADDKPNADLIVSRIVLDTLEALAMTYPASSPERPQELPSIRKQLDT